MIVSGQWTLKHNKEINHTVVVVAVMVAVLIIMRVSSRDTTHRRKLTREQGCS